MLQDEAFFITRESELSIDLSCWSHRRDEAGAGCSQGTNKKLAHENPVKTNSAGVNLQISPIKLESFGSVCCKKYTQKGTDPSLPFSEQSITHFPSCCPKSKMVYDQKPMLLQTETLMRLRMLIQCASDNCRAPANFWGSDSPGQGTSHSQSHLWC